MAGVTRINSYKTAAEVTAAAQLFLNTGFRVWVLGPTDVVRLQHGKEDAIFWSQGDTETVAVLIATKDDMEEVKLPE
jgi:hypothetical protein